MLLPFFYPNPPIRGNGSAQGGLEHDSSNDGNLDLEHRNFRGAGDRQLVRVEAFARYASLALT